MSILVIHLLKMVHIYHEDAQRGPMSAGELVFPFRQFHKVAAIEQAGQAVCNGKLLLLGIQPRIVERQTGLRGERGQPLRHFGRIVTRLCFVEAQKAKDDAVHMDWGADPRANVAEIFDGEPVGITPGIGNNIRLAGQGHLADGLHLLQR